MGKVLAVCVSEVKGTSKTNIGSADLIQEWGIENDAHAGKWHRQVSMLSAERVHDFFESSTEYEYGVFGENLVISGIDFSLLKVGVQLICGDALFEVTQIGKECHSKCSIFERTGRCIMPREGIFAKVIHSGRISAGDDIFIKENRK